MSSEGDGHLEPMDPGLFTSREQFAYYQRVAETLFGDQPKQQARVVVLPSFEPEWVLEISTPLLEPVLLRHAIVSRPIWDDMNTFECEGQVMKAPKEPIHVSASESSLDAELATKVLEQLKLGVQGTRYCPERGVHLDGILYCFQVGCYAGAAHSPGEDSYAGLLVRLAEKLAAAAQSATNDSDTGLEDIRALVGHLEREGRE